MEKAPGKLQSGGRFPFPRSIRNGGGWGKKSYIFRRLSRLSGCRPQKSRAQAVRPLELGVSKGKGDGNAALPKGIFPAG